jgi:hypothetical protein
MRGQFGSEGEDEDEEQTGMNCTYATRNVGHYATARRVRPLTSAPTSKDRATLMMAATIQ